MELKQDATTARLAVFSAVTSVYYVCAGVAVHLLNPAFSPVRNYISDYAVGSYGFVYTSAYWATFLGTLALSVALFRQLRPSVAGRIGALLIAVFGVTYALTAIFPTELLKPGEFPHGAAGAIHAIAALVGWIAIFTAALLVARAYSAEGASVLNRAAGPLRVLGWLLIVAFVGVIGVMASRQPVAGLAEKIFIALREIWLIVAAIALARAAGGSVSSEAIPQA
ncbi:MAG TPA: DUF998 domain-containing protein [Devosiaceae bacterium]